MLVTQVIKSMFQIDSQNAPNIEDFDFTIYDDGESMVTVDDESSVIIDNSVYTEQNVNNFEIGTPENDRLKGSKSQGKNVDILVGIDGQDVLVGLKGSDRFLLGKTDSIKNNVDFGIDEGAFYNQAGDDDYALIKNFDSDQDIIELVGEKSDYSLGATSGDLPEGTGIFKGDELLGIIEGETDLALKDTYFEASL